MKNDSTVLMAQAYPNSQFVGYDCHNESIAQARKHAAEYGLNERIRFETTPAKPIMAGGFGTIRRATETPFNMILEARL